jgi:hypothetical protein
MRRSCEFPEAATVEIGADFNVACTASPPMSRQLREQRVCLFEIGAVEPLGEPAVQCRRRKIDGIGRDMARPRAADDFAAIRARREELRRECAQLTRDRGVKTTDGNLQRSMRRAWLERWGAALAFFKMRRACAMPLTFRPAGTAT